MPSIATVCLKAGLKSVPFLCIGLFQLLDQMSSQAAQLSLAFQLIARPCLLQARLVVTDHIVISDYRVSSVHAQ